MKITIAAAILMVTAAAAHAEACHYASADAIVCTSPKDAATSFDKFGPDGSKADYARAYLARYGCYRPRLGKVTVEQSAKVALEDGWRPISEITVDGRDLWFVADAYLQGDCQIHRSKPVVDYVQPALPIPR